MNITHYTPFRDFETFLGNWSSPFDMDVFSGPEGRRWMPSVDIAETEKEFLVKVEVPEISKKDLEVEISNGMLTVKGERRRETKDEKHHRTERFYGKFERSFTLPENVREEDVVAEQEDGMLYIHLRKSDIDKAPRKLSIKNR